MSDHNLVRSAIRNDSHIYNHVERSLQTCKLDENENVLRRYIGSFKDSTRKNNLKALLYVLQVLQAKVPHENGKVYTQSYMDFNAAFDIYIAFSDYNENVDCVKNDKNFKKQFKDLLLNPSYGLCVYIVEASVTKYVVLRPDDVDLANVFGVLVEREEEKSILNKQMLHTLFTVMENEWDKKILRYILAKTHSYREIAELGMDCDAITRERTEVESFIAQTGDLEEEATKNVIENLTRKRSNLMTRISSCRELLLEKRNKWTTTQIQEREEEVADLQVQANDIDKLIMDGETDSQSCLASRIKYETKKVVKVKRLKMRKLGSGRKQLIDEEDEQFTARSIDNKSTAHGRRHDSVLYLNHRVKKRDLLKLINLHHVQRNLPIIKSVTSVYNRGQAKSKKSLQAKRHLGRGYWCCKKAPKSEGKDNLLTHYCRATKKNAYRSLCRSGIHDHILIRSYDDKAYICPETSTGMASSKKQKVFMSSDSSKQKQLPKYDFPTPSVNCTPGTMEYIVKEVIVDEDGNEKIVTKSQDVVCQIKPKFFVGSDASVWESHLIENRHTEIILHEEKNDSDLSIELRNSCTKLMDSINSYLVQTIKDDVLLLDKYKDNPLYMKYEKKKVSFLKSYCSQVHIALSREFSDIWVSSLEKSLVDVLQDVITVLDTILLVDEKNGKAIDVWKEEENVMSLCKAILDCLHELHLPQLKRKVLDLCDAGPGVGLTNHAVFFRVCAEIMICNYDYYIRLHLAPGDSSNNEVERIQSSVGDAICDGGVLCFDYYEKFADLTEDAIAQMTVSELERYEWDRTERNAFAVCEEVSARVDGAPTVDGYMKSYVSKSTENLFFWDTDFLKVYLETNKNEGRNAAETPGFHYYKMLMEFGKNHTRKGEKFMEYVKNGCADVKDGLLCDFCQNNPPLRLPIKRIPQPYPDTETMKYLHVRDTPLELNGKVREIDDFNPRIQLNKLIESGDIDEKGVEKITQFCEKYIVSKDLVVQHLIDRKNKKYLKEAKMRERAQKRNEDKDKGYKDYKWREMIENGTLSKVLVPTLDKYIDYHKLEHLIGRRKLQKIEGIKSHFYKHIYDGDEGVNVDDGNMDVDLGDLGDLEGDLDSDSDSEETEINDSDDEVMGMTKLIEFNEDGQMELWEDPSLFRVNRFGRTVGIMK